MAKKGNRVAIKDREIVPLGFTDMKVSLLVKADWNYKTEDAQKSEDLLENLKRNGQIENLLVRELKTGFYEVVNGNHRLDVMKILKMETAHVYNLGECTIQHAQRIAIETNETKFGVDNLKLSGLIKELSAEFSMEDLVKTLPYSQEELLDMEKLTDFDWEQFEDTEESEEVDTFSDSEFNHEIKIKVTHETNERWKELKDRINTLQGYDNESKVFEFAIIEALNIPIESIGYQTDGSIN